MLWYIYTQIHFLVSHIPYKLPNITLLLRTDNSETVGLIQQGMIVCFLTQEYGNIIFKGICFEVKNKSKIFSASASNCWDARVRSWI